MASEHPISKNFPGGACPQTPLVLHAYPYIHSHLDTCNPPSKSPGYGPGFSYENLPVIGLVPRLSPRANENFFRAGNDGKLGEAWERGKFWLCTSVHACDHVSVRPILVI